MPPRQKSLVKGRWRAIALSLLLHAAIVAGAVYSWFTWAHHPPDEATLAIEATVVDESVLKGAPPTPKPEPPAPEPVPAPDPAPVEEQGPPKPDPAELEQKKEEERLAAEKLEQEKADQAKKDEQHHAQELKEREDAERKEAEKQAAAKAAKLKEEKAAAEKEASDKKAADKKRIDDAAAAKKAADEKAKAARESELRQSLEAEERANAASTSDEANRWHAQIVARITRAWIKPPSAQPGISCSVSVTQVSGGDVTAVRVNSCSGGDAALRGSVEAAVLRASPLPTPPPGVPFERSLELTFAPQ